jgi:C1A family cysteine protease
MHCSGGHCDRFGVFLGIAQISLWVMMPTVSAATPTPAGPGLIEAADHVDLRPGFDHWGLRPRAQGDRGTCSVFTITGAMEFALAEKQRRATRLSVEFLNWASNHTVDNKQDGGFFSDLWKGFESYGICREADMPYASEFDPELQPSEAALKRARQMQKVGFRLHWIKRWNPNKGLTEAELAEVQETLRRGWPVCGGFLWPKQERWNDGVLEMAPREGVRDGHSVLLVGFRDDPARPGGGVFLARNSGKGLRNGAMSYEYVRSYMNDAVWIDCEGAPSSP